MTEPTSLQTPEIQCSFCAKKKEEVERLMKGLDPTVFICNECVTECHASMEEARYFKAFRERGLGTNTDVEFLQLTADKAKLELENQELRGSLKTLATLAHSLQR